MPPLDHVTLYEALHRGEPGDGRFYQRALAEHGAVLELGAGYGRLAGPLQRAGHRVRGLEIDEAMVARGRALEPAVRWTQGDMATFRTSERFDAIVAAHNTLLCVPIEAVRATFALVVEHLAPGGRLLFDVYRTEGIEDDEEDEPEHLVAVEIEGERHDVFETNRVAAGVLEARYDFRRRDGTVSRLLTVHHLHSVATLRRCLDEAGLTVLDEHGGFDGEPFDDEAERWVVVAARP